jgi:hypothetical protein
VSPDNDDGPAGTPRFLQLTYTAGRAGFGVKQEQGQWSQEERRSVEGRISATAGFGPQSDLDASSVRRCVWDRATAHSRALWHVAPAGRDASGRPGNIFAHCILDRDPDRATALRPINWWRSADLLTPFGHAAVDEAILTSLDPPRAGDFVSHDSVVTHLGGQGEYSRLDLAQVLVDAVAAAMAGGPQVVLGTEGVDAAAQWIGLISHLMSPGSARALSWSVLELPASGSTMDSLEAALRAGLHLICVPDTMVNGVAERDGVVVLDERHPICVGELGGQDHQTHRGQQMPVTAWSVLFESVLGLALDGSPLRRLDEVAATVGDTDLDLPWPLAALVALAPDEYTEARDVAFEVISRCSPEGLRDAPLHVIRACRDLVGLGLGPEPSDASVVLTEAERWSPATDLVWSLYWERVTRRLEWFLADEPPPTPAAGAAPMTHEQVATLVDAAAAWEQPGADDDRARLVLRIVDHLVAVGVHDIETIGLLRDFVRLEIDPRLLLLADGYLIEQVGPLRSATLARVIHPVLEYSPSLLEGRLGASLGVRARQWLFPDGVNAIIEGQQLATPLAVAAVLGARQEDHEPSGTDDWLAEALTVCASGGPAVATHQIETLLKMLHPHGVVPIPRLKRALRRDARCVEPDLLARSLAAGDPWDPETRDVCGLVARSRQPNLSAAVTLIELARHALETVPSNRELDQALRCGAQLLQDFGPHYARHLSEPAAGLLATAVVNACMEERPERVNIPYAVLDALPGLAIGLDLARELLVKIAQDTPPRGRRHPAAWLAFLATLGSSPVVPAWLRAAPWSALTAMRMRDQVTLLAGAVSSLGQPVYDEEMAEETEALVNSLVDAWNPGTGEVDPREVAARLVGATHQEVKRLTDSHGSLLGRFFRGRRG